MGERYLVAATKPWNSQAFWEKISKYPGEWHFIESPEELEKERLQKINPRYIFFLHWSWKVPTDIIKSYTCVAFHMTDVPYGRGGSPLQNLITRGHRETKLTALKMVEDFDAGPVYCKEDLGLEGAAEEVYLRASYLSASMIERIISENITPVPQVGEPTIFRRRKPHESAIPQSFPGRIELEGLFDFVRMLDAETYPRAYLTHGGFRYEFSEAALGDGHLTARVKISPTEYSGI